MVFVGTRKLACKSCIQGHRSSSCNHTDRPLFEIKKKGRPVSQCEKCRHLRQSRRVHSKCECRHNKDPEQSTAQASSSTHKPRKLVPALPNGLKDITQPSRTLTPVSPVLRQKVDPCSPQTCRCKPSNIPPSAPSCETEDGLTILARVAAIYSSPQRCQFSHLHPITPTANSVRSSKRPASPAELSHNNNHKHHLSPQLSMRLPLDLRLPPIYNGSSSTANQPPPPVFSIMPPISVITSLAGSGCTCGLRCRCPGCVQHRGADHVAKDRKDCPDGCGSCVDYSQGIALPQPATIVNTTTTTNPSSATPSIIDQFLTQAAALPQPPISHKSGPQLDPTRLAWYHPKKVVDGRRSVNLPKLKCCSGRCSCPGGQCGCGELCDGNCNAHGGGGEPDFRRDPTMSPPTSQNTVTPQSSSPVGCCSRV